MSLTRFILRFAAPVPRVDAFQRYLFIGPHPDDIEIGAGATIAKLADQGKNIRFLIATDGRYGLGNAPKGTTPESLIQIRQDEARKSAAVLGVTDVHFLGLPDGNGYEMKDLLQGIAREVCDFQPDIISAPDPCVSSECHQDHLNTGLAARQIACFAPYDRIMQQYGAGQAPVKALAYYMTAKPNRFFGTSGYLDKQMKAIFDCHLSQYPQGCADADSIRTYLKLRSVDFGIRSFCVAAEGFRILAGVHMHCLPEAGS